MNDALAYRRTIVVQHKTLDDLRGASIGWRILEVNVSHVASYPLDILYAPSLITARRDQQLDGREKRRTDLVRGPDLPALRGVALHIRLNESVLQRISRPTRLQIVLLQHRQIGNPTRLSHDMAKRNVFFAILLPDEMPLLAPGLDTGQRPYNSDTLVNIDVLVSALSFVGDFESNGALGYRLDFVPWEALELHDPLRLCELGLI